jgi:hypothetical protein
MLFPLVSAFPRGAPSCEISTARISLGHASLPAELGYSLQLSPNQGRIDVQINSQARRDFQGILMYVTPKMTEIEHLGTFQFANSSKWRYQQRALCESSNIMGEFESTVTHLNRDRVPVNLPLFSWTPGVSQQGNANEIVFRVAIASSDPNEQGRPYWQYITQLVDLRQFQGQISIPNQGIPTLTRSTTAPTTNPTTTPSLSSATTYDLMMQALFLLLF